MTTSTQANELFALMAGKAVETFTLCADANQKILRELVDLSATTAKEGVRLYAELQSSAVDAVKEAQAYGLRRQAESQETPGDPAGSCQKGILDSVEGAQKAFKLAEGNAQALTRSAGRLQATAEQAGREIHATFVELADKARSLYAPLG